MTWENSAITIATFHSWFLQLLRSAPLDAGAPGEVNLVEQTTALVDEAWELFASGARRDPQGDVARGLDRLFRDCGLHNTRRLLTSFLYRRAEWLAYTHGQADPVGYALANTPTMASTWMPFLIAWLCKALVLRYGGMRLYRRSLPFFLGLILGDFLNGGFWTLLGCFTRINVYPINW